MSSNPPSHSPAPVGAGEYVVQQGDCLSSIAYEHGFVWETLWNHPDNSELKRHRKSPFQLLPGDRVKIPPLEKKEQSAASDQLHKFRRKSVPAIVKLKVLELEEEEAATDAADDESDPAEAGGSEVVVEEPAEQALATRAAKNKPFDLFIDGIHQPSGRTDGDGLLELDVPPNAREARVVMEPGTPRERVLLVTLGGLDPVHTPTGQAQRLANLGWSVDTSGQDPPALREKMAEFQKSQGLSPSGTADDATLDALQKAHGG